MQVFILIGFPHDLVAHYLRFGSAPVVQGLTLTSASILPDLIGTAPDLFFDSGGRVACCLGDRLAGCYGLTSLINHRLSSHIV